MTIVSDSKCGRPRRLSERERELCRDSLKDVQTPMTAALSNFNSTSTIRKPISYSTYWRTLDRNGIVSRVIKTKPLLEPKHLRARRAFYYANKDKKLSEWRKCAFADETQIMAHPKSGKLYFRKRLESHPSKDPIFPTKAHGGFSIMIWSYITYDGPGDIVEIEGTLTGEKYCKVLEVGISNKFIEKYVLVEDNDKKHKSEVATEYKDIRGIEVLPWPSRSPDLNPVENAWAILKKEYKKLPLHMRAKDSDDLARIILDIWNNIPLQKFRKLVDSMPKRLKMLKQHEWKPIKY